MNHKNLLILSILLLSILVILGCSPFAAVKDRTLPNSYTELPAYTVGGLKERNPDSGEFNIDAFVVKIYECPPCPIGSCKPCMGDNILASDINELKESYSFTNSELILFTAQPKQFELGKKYRFSIAVLSHNPSNKINGANIMGYDLLKDQVMKTNQ